MTGEFDDLIPSSRSGNTVNALLTLAQMRQESGFDPGAISPKGARGLMQLMPETQKEPGFGVSAAMNDSPSENVRVGEDYRNAMIERYGDVKLGLMAYNWGPGNVDKWLHKGADPSSVPSETRQYVSNILGEVNASPPSTSRGGIEIASLDAPASSGGEFDDLIPAPEKRAAVSKDSGKSSDVVSDLALGLGQGARAGLEGLGFLHDIARMPLSAVGMEIPSSRDILDKIGDQYLGGNLPEPSGGAAVGADLARGAASAIPALMLGAGIAKSASPFLKAIGSSLQAAPAGQIGAFATGEAARGATERGGGGALAQLAASLAGGIPGFLGAERAAAGAARALGSPVSRLSPDDAVSPLIASGDRPPRNADILTPEGVALARQNDPFFSPSTPAALKEGIKFAYDPKQNVSQNLKTRAQEVFGKADEAGGAIAAKDVNKFLDDMPESIRLKSREGKLTRGTDTEVQKLMTRWEGLRDQPITYAGAREIEMELGDMISGHVQLTGKLDAEGRKLFLIQNHFRDVMLSQEGGFGLAKEARGLWSQYLKAMEIERIVNNGMLSDNPATSIRSGLRFLLKNPKRTIPYTARELKAIRQASETGSLQEALRIAGSRLLGIISASQGNIPGAIIAVGAGKAARGIAAESQLKGVQKIIDAITEPKQNGTKSPDTAKTIMKLQANVLSSEKEISGAVKRSAAQQSAVSSVNSDKRKREER